MNKHRHSRGAKSALVYKKCECFLHSHSFLVGVARLELAALRSRTVRATKLRYTPKSICSVSICCGAFGSASRISVRSCVFYNRFVDISLFLKCTRSIRSTYRKPNCATPRKVYVLFQSAVARLGARRAFPLGLAFSTTDSSIYPYS